MNYREALSNVPPQAGAAPVAAPPKKPVKQAEDASDNRDDDADTQVSRLFGYGLPNFQPRLVTTRTTVNAAGGAPADYNSLKCGAYPDNPNRQAPPELLHALRPGDVVYFAGSGASSQGHAEMYAGNGKFCSDAAQGSNFFANADFTHGSYRIYHCDDPNFHAEAAVNRIEGDTAGQGYGGECAKEVRIALQTGLGGRELAEHASTAAGYTPDMMRANNFHLVGSGGPDGFVLANASPPVVKPAHIAAPRV